MITGFRQKNWTRLLRVSDSGIVTVAIAGCVRVNKH